MRVLVGAVGYRNLRDFSAGLAVAERLTARRLPGDILIEDLSYNPIAVAQRLQDEPPDRPFSRVVFASAVQRQGARRPGAITAYRWDRVLPSPDQIHQAMCDAVTGIIHLDNTLIVLEHLRALPRDVCVVEIEPLTHEFGETFSEPVGDALEQAAAAVASIAGDGPTVASLPVLPLGGTWTAARAW